MRNVFGRRQRIVVNLLWAEVGPAVTLDPGTHHVTSPTSPASTLTRDTTHPSRLDIPPLPITSRCRGASDWSSSTCLVSCPRAR